MFFFFKKNFAACRYEKELICLKCEDLCDAVNVFMFLTFIAPCIQLPISFVTHSDFLDCLVIAKNLCLYAQTKKLFFFQSSTDNMRLKLLRHSKRCEIRIIFSLITCSKQVERIVYLYLHLLMHMYMLSISRMCL